MLESVGIESKAGSGGAGRSQCLELSEMKQDPMRIWQEMKRNGFVTPSFGQTPPPKDQQTQPQPQRKRNRNGPTAIAALASVESNVGQTNLFTPCEGVKHSTVADSTPQSEDNKKSEVDNVVSNSATAPAIYAMPVQVGQVKKGRVGDTLNPTTVSCIKTAMVMPTECSNRGKKMKEPKVKVEDRFPKIAAPSGLLDHVNPGIINRVRSSQQVFSVIKALVKESG